MESVLRRIIVGFSINDKIHIGHLSFDIQTEAKGNKIIGEILSQGKVLQRIEKENPKPNSQQERTLTLELHKSLKQLIISKIQEKSKSKKTKVIKVLEELNEHKLRKELLKYLEINEENLKIFFFREENEKIEIHSIFDSNYKSFKIDKWIESIEEEFFTKSALLEFCGIPHLILLPIKWQEHEAIILLLNEKDRKFKAVLVITNVRISIIRRKIHNNSNILKQIVKSSSKGKE